MNANFGSIIWNLLFEPLTPDVKALIVNDINRIINSDPRIRVDNVLVDQLDLGLQIQVDITILPDNYTDSINLQFNRELNTVVAA